MANLKTERLLEFFKNTFQKFSEENTTGIAASLAYYTIFSLPPLLIIIIHASGIFSEQQQVQNEILQQIGSFAGDKAVQQVKDTINHEGFLKHGTLNTILSLITLFFTSTSLFVTIQGSLNSIFRVKAKPKHGYFKMLRDRAISFGMILLLAAIFVLSLLFEGALHLFKPLINNALPHSGAWLLIFGTHLALFLLKAFLLTILFKFLPDAKVRWKDTIIGALVTAALFFVGKLLIGYYIGHSHLGSIYDAAGSIMVILVWVYYSSVIFFFGAQFTYVYARFYGLHIKPASYAVRVVVQETELDEDGKMIK